MSRTDIPNEDDRAPFYLFVDEFQHFVSEAFDKILAMAREFRLSLVIAHQESSQLPEKILRACANAATLVVFRSETPDARAIAPSLANFALEDILAVKKYQPIVRIGRRGNDFSLRTLPDPEGNPNLPPIIRQRSREKHTSKVEPPKEEEKDDFKFWQQ